MKCYDTCIVIVVILTRPKKPAGEMALRKWVESILILISFVKRETFWCLTVYSAGLTAEEIETAIQRSGTAGDENALPAKPSNSIVPVNPQSLPTVPQGIFC